MQLRNILVRQFVNEVTHSMLKCFGCHCKE